LKVLPEGLASDPEYLERFAREAEAIAALNHPNIVTIYSVEELEGVRCLTMELIEGHTLAARILPDPRRPTKSSTSRCRWPTAWPPLTTRGSSTAT